MLQRVECVLDAVDIRRRPRLPTRSFSAVCPMPTWLPPRSTESQCYSTYGSIRSRHGTSAKSACVSMPRKTLRLLALNDATNNRSGRVAPQHHDEVDRILRVGLPVVCALVQSDAGLPQLRLRFADLR